MLGFFRQTLPHLLILLGGGMFTGTMAFFVQGRAFGFANVTLAAVAPAVMVGATAATAIAYLIRRNRRTLVERLKLEQEISARLKAENEERQEMERVLRDSEARYRTLAQVAPVGIFETDVEGACLHVNETWCRIAGLDDAAARGDGWVRAIHPEDQDMVARAWADAAARGETFSLEYRFQRPDGGVSCVLGRADARIDAQGQVTGYVGTITDITAHKETELQLQQALKMEAVGQLTGGVAHDFNNLLAVIVGNAELLKDRLGSGDASVDAVFRAAGRGAELTDRLLAFSRQKPLQPATVEPGDLVAGMLDLLRRTLGETIDIDIDLPAGLWPVWADPGQMENALLNLSINARDAMQDGGGRLRFTCANRTFEGPKSDSGVEMAPGDYVEIRIDDSGAGMSADVRGRAFEPFFTTKEVGQGSGLGLSMVYGFARQSGGQATIYSEEGQGTSVKLYLPRAAGDRQAPAAPAARTAEIPAGRGESILVIEDEAEVRTLVVRMLEGLGYHVTGVASAAAARAYIDAGKPLDLILSDVVLPGGVSGPEFAADARAAHPGLKVVFMSGYPAETAGGGLLSESGEVLLNKPFERRQLATALRDALG